MPWSGNLSRLKFAGGFLFLMTLVLVSCQLPASVTPTPPASQDTFLTQGAATALAELTSQAAFAIPATQTALAAEPLNPPTWTTTPAGGEIASTPTEVVEQPSPSEPAPSSTPVKPTATATSPAPTPTPTLAVSTLTALQDTNCRQGPGGSYAWVSGLRAGKSAAVYGKDASGTWWFIERPSGKANEYCWVWGRTTEVDGEADDLPVIPPYPPQLSPVISQWYFSVDAVNLHVCGVPNAFLLVQNFDFASFESARILIRNVSTGQVLGDTQTNRPFTSDDRDCSGGFDTLGRNQSAYLRGEAPGGTSGDLLVANISLCTEEDLEGNCYFESVSFSLP
jgi:hypothetical protein